jgi:hypothetical protein
MKTIQELVPLIQEWAKERGIFEKGNVLKQLFKSREEFNELVEAYFTDDKEALTDAIGDLLITLINVHFFYEKSQKDFVLPFEMYYLSSINNMKHIIPQREQTPLGMIKRLNVLIFNFLEDIDSEYLYKKNLKKVLFVVYLLCEYSNLNPIECLNIAYNEIKNRTGKMINGKFVKDER